MYTKQNNMLIRQTLRLYGTPLWKLGKILGISESSVTRLMRDELPEEEQVRIISLIEKEEGKEKFFEVFREAISWVIILRKVPR